nr:UbiA-like protein EboC [Allomuricauda sp.]
MNKTLKGYLQLCRPANLPTAAADVIAGMALAGLFLKKDILSVQTLENGNLSFFLVFSSISLYAGGVVLNDVFDSELDKIERPERPIPSGTVPLKNARWFGVILLVFGCIFAFLASQTSGLIAMVLALTIVAYDAYSKQFRFLGPLNMGICRGLNLLLGISFFGSFMNWEYVFIPIIFIAAITMISQGEVHGENRNNIVVAAFLYVVVIFFVGFLHHIKHGDVTYYPLFLLFFTIMVFVPLVKAYRNNIPHNVKSAVKSGVLSIIILDAAIAVGYSHWLVGLLLVLLLPLSILLSKIFAVT